MTARQRGLVVLALAGGAATAWWAWPVDREAASAGCPVGARGYRVDLELAQATALPGVDGADAVASSIRLDAPLTIAHAWEDGRCLASLRLGSPATASATLAGQELLDDAARRALVTTDVVVEVADGAATRVHLPPDAPIVVQNVLALLAAELALPVDPPAARREPAYAGTADARYAVIDAGDGRIIERRRVGFAPLRLVPAQPGATTAVTSTARGVVDGDGALRRLAHAEAVEVTDAGGARQVRLDVQLVVARADERVHRVGPLAGRLAGRRAYAPGASVDDEVAAARARAGRIAGLTGTQLIATVRELADDRFDDELRFMWRATALLAEAPALLGELAAMIEAGELTDAGRRLALDLLAGTDHPEAQRALARAVATARDDDARYVEALTRYAVIERATAATVEFLVAEHARERARDATGERAGTALTMVGAAGAVATDPAARVRVEAYLARALDEAGDPAARAPVLAAIHNAGSAALIEAAASLATSADDRDRAGVARSVRKVPGARSIELLRSLVTDPSPRVQRIALESLHVQPITPELVTEVARLVIGARISPGALGAAVPLIRLAPPALRRDAAVAMLAQLRGGDEHLRAQILALLGA